MEMKNWRITAVVLTAVASMLIHGTLFNANAFGKFPRWNDEMYAGAYTFHDLPGDAVTSDGEGAYIDGIDGECVHDLVSQEQARIKGYADTRVISISLGTCVSTSCEDPFGGAGAGQVLAGLGLLRFYDENNDLIGNGMPPVGETWYGGGIVINFTNGTDFYYLLFEEGPNGQISVTTADEGRTSVSVGANATARLYKAIVTTSTRGKKTTTSYKYVHVGSFTNMPFGVTFDSLSYLRGPVDSPYLLSD